MRNVRFDVATEDCHFAGFAVTRDALFRPANEAVEFGFGDAVLLKRVVIGMNGHRAKRDDFIAMENPNIFSMGGALEKR
jgi:hypothetical protein